MSENTEKYERFLGKWQEKNMETSADFDVALSNFKVLFAYNSNAIENPETTYHDTREIFENGNVSGYTGNLRTLFEIQNQKECYEFLRGKILEKQLIDVNLIKEIHGILLKGCYDESRFDKGERPGTFKVNDFVVGDNIGALASETKQEVQELCKEINDFSGNDILVAAAYLHLNFESIHPFADGNGRVGRTLMNYFLMINGYPPAIIYDEDKKTYYMALAVFDKTGSLDGFKEFLMEQTLKTWQENRQKSKPLNEY